MAHILPAEKNPGRPSPKKDRMARPGLKKPEKAGSKAVRGRVWSSFLSKTFQAFCQPGPSLVRILLRSTPTTIDLSILSPAQPKPDRF
uniref:Uncharacterized protein n=1 Tax=Setaria italica TaxID=4555 RepID=K3ZB90_SETIT